MQTEAICRLKLYQKVSAALLILALFPLGMLQAAEESKTVEDAAAVKNLFEMNLPEPGIQVVVKPLPDKHFWVTLTGSVASETKANELKILADKIKPKNVTVTSKLAVLKPQEKEETVLWPLTYFLSSRIESDSSITSSRSSRVTELLKTLNDHYGKQDRPVAFLAGGGSVLLRGTREQLQEITRFLALIDSPWPQVQMTLWALQVSGSQEEVAKKVDDIAIAVRVTRDDMMMVQRELAQIAREDLKERLREGRLQGCAKRLFEMVECRQSSIFLPISGPLSLNESLILLTVRADRQNKVESLRTWFEKQFPQKMAERRAGSSDYQPFRRLEQVLNLQGSDADCEAFENFVRAYHAYSNKVEGAPEAVIRTGTILDRVLKAGMDAYAADMSEFFLDPLLRSVQDDGAGTGTRAARPSRKGDGVSLIGRSRIVVTSGLTSGLTPEMSSSVETSRPKPFGEGLLDQAFPAKEGGNPELTGADRILAGLSQGQALLLAAALSEPEPRFSKVAPGIEVKVRPTVLPDGAAARLTIDARFGVTTTPLDPQAGTDTTQEPPAPAINSHRVETDAAVDVFDLFDISSFSMTTSHPRAPYFVPILGRLPILGRAFQWPRNPKVVQHESMILVNTVVLPRAVNLSLFYRIPDFEREPLPAYCHAASGSGSK